MPMNTGPDHHPLIDEQLSAWLDDELPAGGAGTAGLPAGAITGAPGAPGPLRPDRQHLRGGPAGTAAGRAGGLAARCPGGCGPRRGRGVSAARQSARASASSDCCPTRWPPASPWSLWPGAVLLRLAPGPRRWPAWRSSAGDPASDLVLRRASSRWCGPRGGQRPGVPVAAGA